jgi:acyl-ACP thioesterase
MKNTSYTIHENDPLRLFSESSVLKERCAMVIEKWQEAFPLRLYEVSSDGRATVTTLMNLFQEVASHHAEHLDCGFSYLYPRNLGWVLSKFYLRMERFPRYGEVLTLRTWPRERKRIFAFREVEFLLGSETVGRGTSAWCVIDLGERKALSVEKVLVPYPLREEAFFSEEPASLPRLESPSWEWSTTPRITEIDMNGHVNNAVYLGWAVEALPREIPFGHLPGEVGFLFRKEVSFGESVRSLARRLEENQTLHRLENSQGEEVARVRIRWIPRESC